MKTTILVVDDHPITRKALLSLIESDKTLKNVGEASDGVEAIRQVVEKQPDVVVMDITMPNMSGIDATKEILISYPDVKVIALSIHSGNNFVKEMLNAGAVGYILKEDAPEELLIAVKRVSRGDIYLSAQIISKTLITSEKEEKLTKYNILQTKLLRPSIMGDFISRSRISDKLERNVTRPFSLVSASAGYGKSVAVSQWLERTSSLYSWLSLDDEHNDLRIFLLYIVEALKKTIPGSMQETEMAVSGAEIPPYKALSFLFLNDLFNIDQDLILVLDDYHNIRNESIHALLDEWLKFPPPHVHLSIITRRDPPLGSINSLRINARMTEIRMNALSFTTEDIALFFRESAHIYLKDSSLQILHDTTEGWVIAVRLASLLIKNGGNIDEVILAFNSGQNTVSEYLTAEVLSMHTEYLSNWLLTSSILNRFCGDLLDEIAPDDKLAKGQKYMNGEAFVAWLNQANMFVIDLDLEGIWFRYHHLFQSLLQDQLRKKYSELEIRDMHLKACRWFEKNDFLQEAMDYALLSGTNDRAVEIIKTHRITLLNKSNWQLLTSLYRRLPKSITEVDPELLLVEAYLSFYQADHVQIGKVVHAMEPLMRDLGNKSKLHGEYHFFLAYTTIYLKGDAETSLKYIEIALRDVPESADEPRALVELFYPLFSQIAGQYVRASKWLEKTISISEGFADIRRNRLFLSILLTSTSEARLDQVESYYITGLKVARDSKSKDSLGTCLMMAGELFMRRGEWSRAIQYFEEVLDIKYYVHTRSVVDSNIALIVLYAMLEDHTKCRELIKDLDTFVLDLDPHHERFLWSCKLRYLILVQDAKAVRDLIPYYSLNFVHLVFWIDVPEITYARALIYEGSEEYLALAENKLKELEKMAIAQHNWIHLLEIYALQAFLYDKLGKLAQAQKVLVKSLDIAEPGNVISFYLELGKSFEHLIGKMPTDIQGRPFVKVILMAIKNTMLHQTSKTQAKVGALSNKKEKLNTLTKRELAVLQCIAEGLRNQEIADKLFNSEETIKKHVSNMLLKFHVKNRMSLVTKAREMGVLKA